MEKMEIVIPIFLLEKQKIIALEDRVIVEYTSPLKEYRVEYKYGELKPRIVRGKGGDPGWTTLGNYLLGTAFFIAIGSVFIFRTFLDSPYYTITLAGLVAFGLVAHCLRLVKYDKVWFDEKDGSSGFLIKLTKHNREDAEKMISYIAEKINQVKSVIASQVD
jgi:hypothetical protein